MGLGSEWLCWRHLGRPQVLAKIWLVLDKFLHHFLNLREERERERERRVKGRRQKAGLLLV